MLLIELCYVHTMHPGHASQIQRQLRSQAAAPCRILQDADRADDVRWLPGAKLNIAESALWGREDSAPALALCWAEELAPQSMHSVTWADLRAQSILVASALQAQGLQPGQSCPAYAGCADLSCALSVFQAAQPSVRLFGPPDKPCPPEG